MPITGFAEPLGTAGHPDGRLAVDALAVDAPSPVMTRSASATASGQFQGASMTIWMPGPRLGAEQTHQGGAHATGTRPWDLPDLLAERLLDAVGVAQPGWRPAAPPSRGRPLLRAKHRRGPFRTTRRIVHVAGHLDGSPAERISPLRSMVASSARPAPPTRWQSHRPLANLPPRAWIMPAPPSLVALPPMPG